MSRRGAFLAARALSRYVLSDSTHFAPKSTSFGSDLFKTSLAVTGSVFLYFQCDLGSRQNSALAEISLKEKPSFPSVTLYQYEVCPFCCKVRTFLDYHKIPYEVIEVNPITKTELKWTSYKKVPVLKLDGKEINDSEVIISTMTEQLEQNATPSWLFKNSKVAADGSEEEKKWRRWVNEKYVRIITANIYRNLGESWQTFDYIVEHGNFGMASRAMARMFGTATMYVIGQRMPKKYNIEGDLREALYSATNEWIEAIGTKDYLGGKEPNLADLAVFGVIRAVEGTNTFKDLMKHTKVGPWHSRMSTKVGETCRTNKKESNEKTDIEK